MTWTQRPKRVFDIDTCEAHSYAAKAIAEIEEPVVIEKILAQVRKTDRESVISQLPVSVY